MSTKLNLIILALLAAGLCAQGCSAPTPKNPPASANTPTVGVPFNKFCPVDPKSPVDPTVTCMYNGKCYGFCCEDCRAEFQAHPAKYAADPR